ncbi:hypothetical protein EMWEY_00055340 [Eimeria maxima]|uniref:Uncharacterized protein n=1 Tax=Eimeria maxima TaxID=5804 RepID=U6M4D2_EIMMA|nr:hypothetical protein EMWEY_00055340 [Eimeria maxima]CDJ59057.1 hypothetical protein EMWEY_00055340 [Eimeria maxima]
MYDFSPDQRPEYIARGMLAFVCLTLVAFEVLCGHTAWKRQSMVTIHLLLSVAAHETTMKSPGSALRNEGGNVLPFGDATMGYSRCLDTLRTPVLVRRRNNQSKLSSVSFLWGQNKHDTQVAVPMRDKLVSQAEPKQRAKGKTAGMGQAASGTGPSCLRWEHCQLLRSIEIRIRCEFIVFDPIAVTPAKAERPGKNGTTALCKLGLNSVILRIITHIRMCVLRILCKWAIRREDAATWPC